MSPEGKSKNIEKGHRWSVFSFVVGIIGLIGMAIGLYLTVRVQKPNIAYEIVSEANVLDIHKPLEDLTIEFQGEDIQKKNLNLRIFQITIRNSGETDIRQDDWDQNLIWGLTLSDGKVIDKVRLLDPDSGYIPTNLEPRLLGDDTVKFEKLVFDKGESFTVELLVLHAKNKQPEILPLGKIAGVDRMEVIKSGEKREKIPFWSGVFYGSTWTHVLRAIIYFVGSFGLIYLILIGSESIPDWWRSAYRKFKTTQFKRKLAALPILPEQWIRLLTTIYMRGHVRTVLNLLYDEYPLRHLVKEIVVSRENKASTQPFILSGCEMYIDDLYENDIITIDSVGQISVDPLFIDALRALA